MKVAPVSFGFDPGVLRRLIGYYRNPAGDCQFQRHPQFAKAQPQMHKDAKMLRIKLLRKKQ
jgi:hypothetical protein